MRTCLAIVAIVCAVAAATGPARAVTAQDARTLSFKLQSDGMRLYKEGRYAEATEAFRQVVNLNLNSFMAHHYLGLSLIAERRYAEAIEPLKTALDLEPGYVQSHLALGEAYLKQGDASESKAEFLRTLELQPNSAAALDGLGRLLETTGQDDAAERHYRKALDANSAYADASAHLADLYLRQGRVDDAIDLILKAIGVRPDFSAAYTRLGIAYARLRLFDDAIAATRRSMELAPRDAEPCVSLARIHLELGSFRRAEAGIQAALALDPDHPGAFLLLADLKRASGDFDGAIEVLETLQGKGVEDALLRRAATRALLKTRGEAAEHAALRKAAETDHAGAADLASLARFLSAAGGHARAGELFERAGDPTRAPDDVAAAESMRHAAGVEYVAARRDVRALEIFQALASGAADDAVRDSALFNLGVVRSALGLDESAVEAYEAYRTRVPGDPTVHLYLGNAYFRLGRKPEARREYGAFLDSGAPEKGGVVAQVRRLLRFLTPGTPDPVTAGPRRPS